MVIKNSEVNAPLKNKLVTSDIDKCSESCKRSAYRTQLLFDIITRTSCEGKCALSKAKGFVIPEGNVTADVMIIGEPPTKLEGDVHTSFFDASGRLITVILDKLGLTRDNIYVTHVTKCYTSEAIDEVHYTCALRFLMREIDLVRPKLIITLGIEAANVLRTYVGDTQEVTELDDVRNRIYKGKIVDHEFAYAHALSPSVVLSKNGAMYNKYKADLWNDIAGPVRALKQVP